MWWGFDQANRYVFFNVRNLGSTDIFAVEISDLTNPFRAYWHDDRNVLEKTLRNGEMDYLRIAQLDPNAWMEHAFGGIAKDMFEKRRAQNLIEVRVFTPLVPLWGDVESRWLQMETPLSLTATVFSHKRSMAKASTSFGITRFPTTFVLPYNEEAMESSRVGRAAFEKSMALFDELEAKRLETDMEGSPP
jgi:hypothetical protein